MIWHSTDRERFIAYINTDIKNGLSAKSAKTLLAQDGENVLRNNINSFATLFFKQLKTLPIFLLLIAIVINAIVDISFMQFSLTQPLLIISIVLIKAFVGAFVSYRAEHMVNKTAKIHSPTCKVIRDGHLTTINASGLVVGDVISVSEGDSIVADARLIETVNLHCDESAITGELVSREKDALAILDEICPVSERVNMIYAGCFVSSGSGLAIVTETGNNTEISKINNQHNNQDIINNISNKIDSVYNKVTNITISLCAALFIIEVIINLAFTNLSFLQFLTDKFVLATSLAVSTIPDALSFIAVVSLAFGTQHMLQKNCILKNKKILSSLNSISVICSDKTGTLTTNIMNVTAAYTGNEICEISSIAAIDKQTAALLRLAALCTDVNIGVSDPTQTALTEACLNHLKLSKNDLEALYPRVAQIPFDADRKLMTTVNMIDGVNYSIVKGAADSLLPLCTNCDINALQKVKEEMAGKGLRIIAVGIKPLNDLSSNPTVNELESNLVFIGFLGLNDRIRSDSVESVALCANHSIKTIMITGDPLATATAIATKLGILTPKTRAVSSSELAAMSDDELYNAVDSISVYADVSTEDKLRIISAWQARGKTVAVTGDSVTDSYSLRSSNVGFAMGIKGTDVAKGAADVIISDDCFSTIPEAIKQSRSIFNNIKNAFLHLMTCKFSRLSLQILSILVFRSEPFSAIQLLWISLICEIPTTIVACMDRPDNSILKNAKTDYSVCPITKRLTASAFCRSAVILIVTMISLYIGMAVGPTTAFVTLSVAYALNIISIRTQSSIIFMNLKNALSIFIGAAATLLLSVLTVATPLIRIIGFTPISAPVWLWAAALGLIPTIVNELVKLYKSLKKD